MTKSTRWSTTSVVLGLCMALNPSAALAREPQSPQGDAPLAASEPEAGPRDPGSEAGPGDDSVGVAPEPEGPIDEMHLSRSGSSDRTAAKGAAPGEDRAGTSRAPGRARTMEEVAGGGIEELNIRNVHWRYSLNFFGDVFLGLGHPAQPDHSLSFGLGAQDILIKGELSNHIVTSTELAIEASETGEIGIDIERFNVRWYSPRFYVEAGRSHTAFGYWNNAYHHGKWLQLTIDRPRWVAFEDDGGLLPVHWVGLNAGAKLDLGSGALDVVASLGNGRGKIVDDVRNTRDYQSMKALHLGLELVGVGLAELRVGVAAVADRIPAQTVADRPALPDRAIDELIGSGHVAYASVPLLLIAESYAVVHRVDSQRWTTFGGFLLVGYAFDRFTPYLELERFASRGGSDPFFNPGVAGVAVVSFDTVEGIAGLRIDLSDWTALKAEYRITRTVDRSTTFQEGIVNWSWGF